VPGTGPRSRVVTRTACPGDLPAVLELVAQDRTEASVQDALTGHVPPGTAAAGFGRLLRDDRHQVVLAVLPGTGPGDGAGTVIGFAVLGLDALSVVLGAPQATVECLVVHRDHRRRGAGTALLAAAAAFAAAHGAEHVVAAVDGHRPERQRFLARMGFAPLSTRRIVGRRALDRSLAAWRRGAGALPMPRQAAAAARRRLLPRPGTALGVRVNEG
jgi:ribosomal protein S18 acetylase RimI-like enzyme